jgi:hypothetical protein
MCIHPAARQCFPGRKGKRTLVEGLRILRVLSTLVAAYKAAAKRIKQVFSRQDLDEIIIARVFQKHGILLLAPVAATFLP